jgi:hypothetical protein
MVPARPIFKLTAGSVVRFLRLAAGRRIRLRRDRLRQAYCIGRGRAYLTLRETVSEDGTSAERVVLVVGFRLRLLRSLRFPHWRFQRVCILTMPFWSGFRGFCVKLWMVDPRTRNYLDIYDRAGRDHARIYFDALVRVLRPLSTPGSVWYDLYPYKELEPFLRVRKHDRSPAAATRPWQRLRGAHAARRNGGHRSVTMLNARPANRLFQRTTPRPSRTGPARSRPRTG